MDYYITAQLQQVLWLGKPEIEVTWVPATLLPCYLSLSFRVLELNVGMQHMAKNPAQLVS